MHYITNTLFYFERTNANAFMGKLLKSAAGLKLGQTFHCNYEKSFFYRQENEKVPNCCSFFFKRSDNEYSNKAALPLSKVIIVVEKLVV